MASTTSSSPALRAHQGRDSSPCPTKQRSLSRMRSMQKVNTALPQMVSITPASAHSSSSVAPSPYLGSIQSSPLINQTSFQTAHLASPNPFELPESIVSPPVTVSPAKESQQQGLMRRTSNTLRDAANSLRRKTSSSTQRRRDESTGPITRRRSDSKTVGVNSNAIDYGSFEDYPPDTPSNGLSISDAMSITSEPTTLADPSPEGLAHTIPDALISGLPLRKITKNKSDVTIFNLDPNGSRVSWRGKLSAKSFQIDNIKSIRRGQEAASYQQELKGEVVRPELCFTINYAASDSSNRMKSLHLAASSAEDVDNWIDTLEALAKHREDLMTSVMGTVEREKLIRTHWEKEVRQKYKTTDVPSDARLDLPEIRSLCDRLHIHCNQQDLEHTFREADTTSSESLGYSQFKEFVKHMRERKDLVKVFELVKGNEQSYMSTTEFLDFLVNTQGFDFSDPSIRRSWIDKVNELATPSKTPEGTMKVPQGIDVNAFVSFMVSKESRVYALASKIAPKFDRPLSEYFISSSHNTYLTGWQVVGTSSAEAYVTALRRGCRCVEIDCWDGADGNPRVTHGHTKTTAVPFLDCVVAINKWAFEASPYPIIVSLEVHCNPEQQRKMVNIMKETFGEKLVVCPLDEHTSTLPSPEELKYRILVKVKATDPNPDLTPPTSEPQLTRNRSASSPYQKPTSTASATNLPPWPIFSSSTLPSPSETVYSPTDRSVVVTSASSAGEESDAPITSPKLNPVTSKPRKMSKITPYLSALGVYMQGFTLRTPADLVFRKPNHIFSINENRAIDLCHHAELKALFEDHNISHLCRVYPRTMRFHSSNFDPNTFWRRGVQMVALNWQTFDSHMQMHNAMFAAGIDQYGYVLKPDYLRMSRLKEGDFQARRRLPRFNVSFSVKVISAQQIPRPQGFSKNDALNPFIEIQMFCAEDRARGIANGSGGQESSDPNERYGIGAPYRRRTKIVLGNGWNPQFDETIDLSLETKYPELVFVRFIVYNLAEGAKLYSKNCKQVAVFTAKLESLQKGYRHLPLYNGHGEEFIFSTLFCHIAKHESKLLPGALQDLVDLTPRQSILRGILSRGLSGDRTRERSASIEGEQLNVKQAEERRKAGQVMLNEEIRERFS